MKIYFDNDSMSYLTDWDLEGLFEEAKEQYETDTNQPYYWDTCEEYISDKVDSGTLTECDVIVADNTEICPMYYHSDADVFLTIFELYLGYLDMEEFNANVGIPAISFGDYLRWSDGLYGIRRQS